MNDFPYIDFPVHILSFQGFRQPDNKNIVKISSRTAVCDYPQGIVVKARPGYSQFYAKGFDCYAITRTLSPNGRSYINEKMILRAYFNDFHKQWFYYYYGGAVEQVVEKMYKTQKFVTEYSENYKIK